MNLLIYFILTTNPIDGFKLFAKAEKSQFRKEKTKRINELKEAALNAADTAAANGEYSVRYCMPAADKLLRVFVIRKLNDVPGLYVSGDFEVDECLKLDWSQP